MRDLLAYLHHLSLPVGPRGEGTEFFQFETHEKATGTFIVSGLDVFISEINILDLDLDVVQQRAFKLFEIQKSMPKIWALFIGLVLLELTLVGNLDRFHYLLLAPLILGLYCDQCEKISYLYH